MTCDTSVMQQPAVEALQRQLDDYIADVQRRTGVPGIGVALSVHGITLESVCGHLAIDSDRPMLPAAQFQLGCITKLLTAMVALDLVSAGTLGLDSTLDSYIPDLKGTALARQITVRHLLSHTSGYQGLNVADPSIAVCFTWDKLMSHLSAAPLLFQPGSVFSYEHTEYVLLGEILHRVTCCPTNVLFERMIFREFGINPGSIEIDKKNEQVFVADHSYDQVSRRFRRLRTVPFSEFWGPSLSGLTMKLSDMAVIARGLLQKHRSTTQSTTGWLSPFTPMVSVPPTIGGAHREELPLAFGLGGAQYPGALVGHNGSARGQTCGLRLDLERGLVLALGINSWQPYLRDSMIRQIFESLRGPVPQLSDNSTELRLRDLAGAYTGVAGTSFLATLEERGLRCDIRSKLSPLGMQVVVGQSEDGRMHLRSEAAHNSIGFFPVPGSHKVAAMFGLTALARDT
jgi:CubicO group peptidase (beta-lactamase class C family)